MLWFVVFAVVQLTDKSLAKGFSRGVVRELWQSVPGHHVSNLTSSLSYQETPNIKDINKSYFAASWNIGNDYGQRMWSFYRAPMTGTYVFYMTCQDECELWLSTDYNPDNKNRIIFLPFGLNLNTKDWESNAKQVSSPISLISGEFYFMQAIMKAGSNSYDHLSVGVRQPDGKKYRPILNPDLYYEIPEKRTAFFLLVRTNAALVGHVMYARTTVSNMVCSLYCARDLKCQSYNYFKGQAICELNDDTSTNNVQRLVRSGDADFYEKLAGTS